MGGWSDNASGEHRMGLVPDFLQLLHDRSKALFAYMAEHAVAMRTVGSDAIFRKLNSRCPPSWVCRSIWMVGPMNKRPVSGIQPESDCYRALPAPRLAERRSASHVRNPEAASRLTAPYQPMNADSIVAQ